MVLADMPFGKRVGSALDNVTLYPGVLGETERVVAKSGRANGSGGVAVMLSTESRLLEDAQRHSKTVFVERQSVMNVGGLDATVIVMRFY